MRRDALFELLDAVLAGPAVTSAVRLSLEPVFRRQWASACDALSDGSLDQAAFQRLVVPSLAETAQIGGRHLWAMDGSGWPRANAHTSPERTACRVLVAGSARHSIQDGWEFQWLVAIPDAAGSWVLPLSVARRSLAAGTPTQLAIAQVRAVQAARVATETATERPILLLDSSYDVGQLVAANLDVDLLARLARNRRFVRRPTARKRLGRIPAQSRDLGYLGTRSTERGPSPLPHRVSRAVIQISRLRSRRHLGWGCAASIRQQAVVRQWTQRG